MGLDPRTALHARALRWLAQREHSPSELRGKLLRLEPAPEDALVDQVLEQLQARGHLSEQRFVDSRVHQRQATWGLRRIRHELQQHGLGLDPARQQQRAASEVERARALWSRRYGRTGAEAVPPAERARQMRFLAARGFSAEAIRAAVGGLASGRSDGAAEDDRAEAE